MAKKNATHTIGKRKTAVARLYMRPGKGQIFINKKPIESYLWRATSRMVVMQPLELTENVGKFDISVNVKGGGLSGQAGAIRHAISKALVELDVNCKPVLKASKLLTRDSRRKERKLPGQPAARKRFQFSKR
ncbi:MAG: 30S ribosomal protein S9 [Oligoflexales bacterium]|nr:30S ribosomal protein S9 [Oligoflexales bacterium]